MSSKPGHGKAVKSVAAYGGKECPGFDRGKGPRRWRAPNFGSGVKVFIEAEAPRVRCPEHGVVVQQLPWAQPRSGFTIFSSCRLKKSVRRLRSGVGGRGLAGFRSLWSCSEKSSGTRMQFLRRSGTESLMPAWRQRTTRSSWLFGWLTVFGMLII